MIEEVIMNIGQQASGAAGALVPAGIAIVNRLAVLAIIIFGIRIASGQGLSLVTAFNTIGAMVLTKWVIEQWPFLITETLTASRQLIRMVIPGYAGPADLFELANSTAARIFMAEVEVTWNIGASLFAAGGMVFIAILMWVGIAMTGLLAVLEEIGLLIGAIAGPMILGGLCFPLTMPLAWGAIAFMVNCGARIVMMGVASHVQANAVTSVVTVGGDDVPLTHTEVFELFGVSVLCFVFAWGMNALAGRLVGGGMGAMGYATVQRAASAMWTGATVATAGLAAGAGVLGTAISAAASSGGGGGGGGNGGGGAQVRTSSGSGNPFASRSA